MLYYVLLQFIITYVVKAQKPGTGRRIFFDRNLYKKSTDPMARDHKIST